MACIFLMELLKTYTDCKLDEVWTIDSHKKAHSVKKIAMAALAISLVLECIHW